MNSSNEPPAIVQSMAKSKASHTDRIMVLGRILTQGELDALADIAEEEKDQILSDWGISVGEQYQNLINADIYE